MAKIDTRFMTKIAEKPHPLGPHVDGSFTEKGNSKAPGERTVLNVLPCSSFSDAKAYRGRSNKSSIVKLENKIRTQSNTGFPNSRFL